MAGIIMLALVFLTLVVLAPFYGYDSRETLRSKEEEFASLGMTWVEDQAYQQQLADELEAALRSVRAGGTTIRQSEEAPSPHPACATA